MNVLHIEEFVENRQRYQLIDVRSPHEFEEAHIPGAVNVPLFTDNERAIVGRTYRQEGTDQAKRVGLKLVSPRFPEMVDKILAAAGDREIVIYCWRGGMRSYSMCSLLDAMKYQALQLAGGYKAFRRYINHYHQSKEIKVPVFVLNGLTGVGKTLLLHILQDRSCPVLDLEKMANHRGSAFGSVGLGPARSQKDFDALLAFGLIDHTDAGYLIVEGEGKRIGRINVPDYFFSAMNNGPHILLEADIAFRVERIVAEYRGRQDTREELAQSVLQLKKRLGKTKSEELAEKIRQGQYQDVVFQLCRDYYDQYYGESRKNKDYYLAVVNADNLQEAADEVIKVVEKYMK